MENEMQIFEHQDFGQVRTIEQNGQTWFVGKDIANILGYTNASKALNDHVDEEDKLNNVSLSSLGQRGGWLVNESGLYSLILGSQLPTAKKFKHWVTSEVLPSIRKHGAYMTEATLAQSIINPEFLEQIAATLREEQNSRKLAEEKADQLQLENKQLQKKASYLDLILATNNSVNVTQIALDYGISAEKLNTKLHLMGIQYVCHNQWVLYEKYKDKGYVVSETISLRHRDGTPFFKLCTKWTAKGRQFLYNALKEVDWLPVIEGGIKEDTKTSATIKNSKTKKASDTLK